MKQLNKLWLILTIILISGCGSKTEVVYIPQKCVVDSTPEPVIDNTLCMADDFKCIQDKVLLNYEAVKAYAKELGAKQEKCK
jgi:hypothetical protein